MPETPHKAARKIDATIDQLNARWDLQIPRLHGMEARRAGEEAEAARKCSSRIRHFCWKGNVSIDRIIEDFEERAAQRHSDWVYKPGQAKGTLLSLPRDKSFLKRDAISKARLNPQKRLELISILVTLLEDEYSLSRDSDDYQRTSFTSESAKSKSTSSAGVQTARSSYQSALESVSKQPLKVESPKIKTEDAMVKAQKTSTSKKRGSATAAEAQTSKRARTDPPLNQLTFSQLDRRRSERLSNHQRNGTSRNSNSYLQTLPPQSSNPNERSFDTVASEEAETVFSDNEIEPVSSNNTSILEEPSRVSASASQSNFGGTQFEADVRDDLAINRSFEAANKSASASQPLDQLLDTLPTNGPFKAITSYLLPRDLPYWYTFELYRLALHLQCSVIQIFARVTQECGKQRPYFADFWKAAVKICREEKFALPVKSGLTNWPIDQNQYINADQFKSVVLSGRLDFASKKGRDLFDFTLNPIETDKSCRFHRKFGADRFMVLDVPSFAPEWPRTIPPTLKDKLSGPDDLHQKVFDWLGSNDLYIAGRIWRLFYVEPKDVTKKKRKLEGSRLKVHLFAVNGFDFASPKAPSTDNRHRPVSLLELLNWHIPLFPNRESTDLKLFARMHLGLSKTIPTIVLKPCEFIFVPDQKPKTPDGQEIETGEIMNDGNARMSYAMAQMVWKSISNDASDIPSVFQARIAGAKGTWTVDYSQAYPERGIEALWIEITPSQLKIKPHPCERLDADETQRTFEIVKHSHVCTPANLNTQLITILENRGVPRSTFAKLLMAERREYYEDLKQSLEDPVQLRAWRQKWHPSRSDQLEMTWCGDLPDAKEAELDMLLDAGFDPKKFNHIADCLPRIVRQSLENKNDKLWISVPYSTNMFCIPDSSGTLEPGEVQFNFSKPVSDFPEFKFEGRTVLVARNPAHLASDIQAVKFVYRPELRHIKDVIIFSVKGDFPLAAMLSGGDYDGDTVCVIWDDDLVRPFQNAAVPDLPSKQECGVTSETRLIKHVFTVEAPTVTEVNDFMRKCSWFNGIGSRLGEVTKLFERLVYADSQNMATYEALQLAALAGYLVDGAKAGDLFTTEVWRKLHADIFRRRKLIQVKKMAYDDENALTSDRKDKQGQCLNILDHLKFDIGIGETEAILTDFAQRTKPHPERDPDLRKPYDDAWRDTQKATGDKRKAFKDLLTDLKAKVERVSAEWSKRVAEDKALKSKPELPKDAVLLDYNKLCNELASQVREIQPLKTDCYIYDDFIRRGAGRRSLWAQLRASCIYFEYYRNKRAWKLVGRDLCNLKLDAIENGGQDVTYSMTGRMRASMKIDMRKHKIMSSVINDATDDEFFEASETQ